MGAFAIREYTKRDLASLLRNEEFWAQPRLPITKHRVRSQLANPRSEDGDLLLLTACNSGRLVAYIGILPDLMRNNGQAPMKFGWLSTWWAEEAKGGAAAALMFFAAIRKYAKRIAISNFSPDAKRIYDASHRFEEFAAFDLSYFILSCPPEWHIVSPISHWAAKTKNCILFSTMLNRYGLTLQTFDSLDGGLEPFLRRWTAAESLTRDASDWQWILKFPWVSADAEDRVVQTRYAFSVFAKDFRQLPLVVRSHGAVIGFIFLTLRDGRLSLKYAYYDPADIKQIVAALQVVITQINPWVFISADRALNLALRRSIPFYVAVRHKRAFAYAHEALHVPGSPHQLGIGDTVFT
jgi:hypothetical protein